MKVKVDGPSRDYGDPIIVICVKVFGLFLKLSSYSNVIRHMFVISLRVVHFITPFINWPSMCCFFSNQVLYLLKFYPLVKMENFIQSDYFCRDTTVTLVPSLSINDNLVIEISGVVCKKTTLRSRITGGGSNKWGGVRNLSWI